MTDEELRKENAGNSKELKDLIDTCYIISRFTNTSFTDAKRLTFFERMSITNAIHEEYQAKEKAIAEQRARMKA